jgi:DNA-binding SARP family transcriptional activator
MRYEILGPLRVVDDAGVSFISARKMETLLAVLLARCGTGVTTGQLITEIWGEQAPRRANAALHVYISQLRKFLHRPGRATSPIVTRPHGYLLRQGSDELDAQDFQRLMNHGRARARMRCDEDAIVAFESALDMWRGPAMADLTEGPIVYAYATWLEESRLECVELLTESYLKLGRHREVVGRLYALTSEHPLREAFYRYLMVALYRSERQADALAVYRSARDVLRDELGLTPCRALRDLHSAILAGDELLDRHAV